MVTEARTWVGRTLIGNDGSRLGEIAEILEDDDGEEWLAVRPAKDPKDVRLIPAQVTTGRGVRDVVAWLDQAELAQAPSAASDFGAGPEPAPRRERRPAAPPAAAPEPAAAAEAEPEAAPAPLARARRRAPRSAPKATATTTPKATATTTSPPAAKGGRRSRRPSGTNLTEIEGLGPRDAKLLVAAGTRNIDALLADGGSAAGRRALAKETGIDASTILEWVNRADLMRVRGVGVEFSDLLETSGVDTVKELSKRNAANLQAKMAALNDELQLVRRAPSLPEVERWIAEAKELPVAVTY